MVLRQELMSISIDEALVRSSWHDPDLPVRVYFVKMTS